MRAKAADLKETLFRYSEWLDGQGLVRGDDYPGADKRSHDELIRDFLAGGEAR